MKTLAEILRDADPLASEPRLSVQGLATRRQMVLDASQLRDDTPARGRTLAGIAAVALLGIVLMSLYWSRAAVDVVAAVRFEVRLAEEHQGPGLREAVIVGTDRRVYLQTEPVVANGDIAEAHVAPGDSPSTYGVSLTLTPDGAAKIGRATRDHIGRPLAILIDGEVIAVPVVRSPVTTSAIISGNFAKAEAERIVGGILGR